MRRTTWAARFGVVIAAVALMGAFVPSAVAQGEEGGGSGGQAGQSTPGVVVTAENPGTSRIPGVSDLRITLTAGTAKSNETSPSCRPSDVNLRCWGSLVLRIPALGGFSVTGFQIHRLAVGDISCGGCEEGETAATAAADSDDTEAQVNGVAVVANPGTAEVQGTAVQVGDEVQLKITLMVGGTAPYEDTADVVINKFEEGPNKPEIFDTGSQTIQRVRIRSQGNASN